MKKFLLSMLASSAMLFSGASAQPATTQPAQANLRVVVFLSPECPLCQNYSLPLNQLQKQYAGKVEFSGVVPGRAYSTAEVLAFTTKYHIAFPVTIDSSKNLSASLKATITPEVYLLGPKKKFYTTARSTTG
ncbi:redoxin domain-containing protein [Puia sp. P3]|uniref:redoxin domain-containing protein n=1 Tax=Puia sp. P3 TaxID=3423952 RepID=UPI003D67F4A0